MWSGLSSPEVRFVVLFCSPFGGRRFRDVVSLAGLSSGGGRQAPASFYSCGPRVQHQMPHSRTRRSPTSLKELPHLRSPVSYRPSPGTGALHQVRFLSTLPSLQALQLRSCRNLCLQVTPQGHQQLARQGHNPDPPRSASPPSESFLEPSTQFTARLEPQPCPRDLDGHTSDPLVTGSTDALFPVQAVATLIRRRSQPRQRSHLPAIAELPPGKELAGKQPRTVRTDRL